MHPIIGQENVEKKHEKEGVHFLMKRSEIIPVRNYTPHVEKTPNNFQIPEKNRNSLQDEHEKKHQNMRK